MLANTHIRADALPGGDWQLIREGFPDQPEIGPALSRLLLEQVASGERPATVRLSRPGRVVAFGRRDVVSPHYEKAVEAARREGFPGMERLSGGRAAAFSEGALSLTFTVPDPQPAKRTAGRFETLTEVVQKALVDLGADARLGAVPGEYCPGEFSVNARDQFKLAGVGQRMIKGAAHVGFIIVVNGSELLTTVLHPVYEALELEFNPATVGALEDDLQGVTRSETENALLRRLTAMRELEPVELDSETIEESLRRSPGFRSTSRPS